LCCGNCWGPRDLSYGEATRILGERIGQPDLQYIQLPYEEMKGALIGAGLSENFASLQVEFGRALNEGRLVSLEGRNAGNTTQTRFEDFAGELADAYKAL
jgi:hypothetical protein